MTFRRLFRNFQSGRARWRTLRPLLFRKREIFQLVNKRSMNFKMRISRERRRVANQNHLNFPSKLRNRTFLSGWELVRKWFRFDKNFWKVSQDFDDAGRKRTTRNGKSPAQTRSRNLNFSYGCTRPLFEIHVSAA